LFSPSYPIRIENASDANTFTSSEQHFKYKCIQKIHNFRTHDLKNLSQNEQGFYCKFSWISKCFQHSLLLLLKNPTGNHGNFGHF